MCLVELAGCDVLVEVVAVVFVPELQVEGTSIFDDFGFVFFPFGKIRDVGGNWFGDRRYAVAESGRFDLGEHWAMV